jgi:hypothetical protein
MPEPTAPLSVEQSHSVFAVARLSAWCQTCKRGIKRECCRNASPKDESKSLPARSHMQGSAVAARGDPHRSGWSILWDFSGRTICQRQVFEATTLYIDAHIAVLYTSVLGFLGWNEVLGPGHQADLFWIPCGVRSGPEESLPRSLLLAALISTA